jgi:SAM-dependent methyltransferase
VRAWKCGACGFEFSNPEFAGDGRFYAALQAQLENYYPVRAYEFERALDFAREQGLAEVLDVGCGSGTFLTLAKSRGLRAYGMELNPQGVAQARRAGHEVYECLLADLLAREPGRKFDFVTAWQVMEHVPDPARFLQECAAAARPGGFVGVAVPNEMMLRLLCPNDPHGWPPHHISRWRIQDLERAGRGAGLKIMASGADPLSGSLAEHFWELHNRLARNLGSKPHRGGRLLPKLAWLAYRKLGLRHWLPLPGASIYAFYRRES